MRSFIPAALAALALALVSTAPALAAADGSPQAGGLSDPALLSVITNDDLFSTVDLAPVLDPTGTNGTQHYGPYASGSPDSGTCGNDWAEDTFDRHFTVRSNGTGFTVVEQFKSGSFVTAAGPSPGGCETNLGGTVNGGVTGSMHGYFVITNVGSQTSTSPYCNAMSGTNDNCDTTTFINTHFTACYPAICTVTTYFFHYSAGAQGLVFHEWKNASSDRGGDNGDIANT